MHHDFRDSSHSTRRMMKPLHDVVVVGASLAGTRAAEALRRAGFDGSLTIVGSEAHFPPFDRPPLSKQLLAGTWTAEAARLVVDDGLDADLCLGNPAVGLDAVARVVRLADGSDLHYDGLVIATGTKSREHYWPGSELDGIHMLRTVDDCLGIVAELEQRPRVAVVGAGFIGCEVASSCRGRGLDITLIDPLPLPLLRALGPDVASLLAAVQREHGVRLALGSGVAAFRGGARVEGVVLDDGTVLPADLVVVGIGVQPATEWLGGSGLPVTDGVLCDDRCAVVGFEDIVAVGDVARWHNPRYGQEMRVEHWTNAVEQAEYAATVLLEGRNKAMPFLSVPYFWSDQFGMKIQVAGTAGPHGRLLEGSFASRKFAFGYFSGGRLVGALCMNWPARVPRYRKMIAQGAPLCSDAVGPLGEPLN